MAETHKENVIGVVLSGSAHDGTIGLRDIKLAGGVTFAQDDSARFGSMPNSAIAEAVARFKRAINVCMLSHPTSIITRIVQALVIKHKSGGGFIV